MIEDTVDTYEQFAKDYYDLHEDRSVVSDQIQIFFSALPGKDVLDAGCGPGWEAARFVSQNLNVVGIDLVKSFLMMAQEEAPNASFVRMDMRQLGIASSSFDGIWACASFHHIPREHAEIALAEFNRILRPEGILFLTCKRGNDTMVEADDFKNDNRKMIYYRSSTLQSKIREHGFNIEHFKCGDDDWNEVLAKTPP